MKKGSWAGRAFFCATAPPCLGAIAFARLALSCSSASDEDGREPDEPRPQLVVILDTDMPTPADLALDPTGLSPASAIDTVRVDVFSDPRALSSSSSFVTNVFAVPDRQAWPISFGVAGNGGASVLVRARLFRASFALTVVDAASDNAVPDPNVTVDRLFRVDLPGTKGVRHVRVRLLGDCIGTPASLLTEQSCIDANTKAGSSRERVELDLPDTTDRTTTLVGTWPLARVVGCKTPPSFGRKCIPGGFTILGDRDTAGLFGLNNALPLKAVYVDPFYIDETEVTVNQFFDVQTKLDTLDFLPKENDPAQPFREFCTVNNPFSSNQAPLNCIEWEGARLICKARGGLLPSEAEWELAARGFEQRRFPWGDNQPKCCTASVGRLAYEEFKAAQTCNGTGPERVGSHTKESLAAADAGSCEYVDSTPTGILDMGGSMVELTSDNYLPYSHACWGIGLVKNPHCNVPIDQSETHTGRGAGWSQGALRALSAGRNAAGYVNQEQGFRCRYDAERADP